LRHRIGKPAEPECAAAVFLHGQFKGAALDPAGYEVEL
jgi:hypothetical protein